MTELQIIGFIVLCVSAVGAAECLIAILAAKLISRWWHNRKQNKKGGTKNV